MCKKNYLFYSTRRRPPRIDWNACYSFGLMSSLFHSLIIVIYNFVVLKGSAQFDIQILSLNFIKCSPFLLSIKILIFKCCNSLLKVVRIMPNLNAIVIEPLCKLLAINEFISISGNFFQTYYAFNPTSDVFCKWF